MVAFHSELSGATAGVEWRISSLFARKELTGPRASRGRFTSRLAKMLLLSATIGVADMLPAHVRAASLDVAYVESVRGRVLAGPAAQSSRVEELDIIDDQTQIVLEERSELRLCHYRLGKIVRVIGPARVVVSGAGVSPASGDPLDAQPCAAPTLSTFQGGIVTRDLALTRADVALHPTIRLVNRGPQPIRRITLIEGSSRRIELSPDRKILTPSLEHGASYLLVLEQQDGGELKMLLQASREAKPGPLVIIIR